MIDIITIVYIALCAAGLPWWVARQHLGGRSIPLVLFSCLYVVYAVVFGVSVPVDGITLAAAMIALWMSASLIWTDTRQSVFELFNWLSYLTLFCAARTVPLPAIAIAVFPTACIFAAMMVYRTIFRPGMDYIDIMFSFGNGNHNGAYMLIHLFVGLWLTLNMSWYFFPFVVLIAAALIMTKCKAAWTGSALGLIILSLKTGLWPYLLVIACAGITWLYLNLTIKRYSSVLRISAYSRVFLSLNALYLIVKKPFAGWGLNSYRQKLPEMDFLVMNTPIARKIAHKIKTGIRNNRSHRVHNDHLEIMVDLGVTGYLLFVYLFAQISFDPVMLGLFIAVAVNALFFFPLREVHTAAPFWALMGGCAVSVSPFAPIVLPVPVLIVICAICAAIMLKTVKKSLGQWYSEQAKVAGISEETKLRYIDIALVHDPHNGGYLNDAAYYYAKVNPVKAFYYSTKSLIEYDGTRLLHAAYDQFARTLNGAGQDNIVHWAEDNALRLEPLFKPAMVIKEYLAWKSAEAVNRKKTNGPDTGRIITMRNPLIKGVRN